MILQLKNIEVSSAFKVSYLIQLVITMICLRLYILPALFTGLSGAVRNMTSAQA